MVSVGERLVRIPVYKVVLCAVTPCFRNAFEGQFKEAEESSIRLPDIFEQTFRIFLHWAHFQVQLEGFVFDENNSSNDARFIVNEPVDNYCTNEKWLAKYKTPMMVFLRIYVLADRYPIRQLRDDILSSMLGHAIGYEYYPDPDIDIISYAYDNLPATSPFISYFVLSTAYYWLPYGDAEAKVHQPRSWNEDFCAKVMVAMTE
ncbi:hypothetical protein K458DRAFT_351229, partial [Lentithecium fluviatile CBS 122367]